MRSPDDIFPKYASSDRSTLVIIAYFIGDRQVKLPLSHRQVKSESILAKLLGRSVQSPIIPSFGCAHKNQRSYYN